MPIIDYQKAANKRKIKVFSDDQITKKNKEYLSDFLNAYDVTPARLEIFLSHISLFLYESQDIKKEIGARSHINKVFKKLKEEYSISRYYTIINVSLRFVKWLNEGERPKGFTDIKAPSKKKLKRELDFEDMVSWEEGLNLIKSMQTIQMKAMFLTQLDGGFRPSEFTDLDYGDIIFKKPFMVARLKDGKTGSRNVTLFRCVPYLQDWLNNHPTKKKNDPLWIMEYSNNSKTSNKDIERYKYTAFAKRIKETGKRIGLKKPLDFYNLRHSACTLAKKDNLPVELATKKFGHSAEYFLNTYGRLSLDEDLNRHADHLGMEDNIKKKKEELTIYCETCKYVNPPKTDICKQCGTPLTVHAALEMKSDKDKELESMKSEMQVIKEMLKDMAKHGQIK